MTSDQLEAEPDYAATVFGNTIDVARAFTANLAARGEELGLIGPLELPRLWSRHIVNSALVAAELGPGRVGDVGSGAGLPGLVLAIARPDVSFVLIEPMERRTTWLNSQVDELGLGNVEVVRARAEDYPTVTLDQVTARAVSALKKLIPMTAPLLVDGGRLVLLKGASVENEIDAARKQIKQFLLSDVAVKTLGEGVTPETTRIFTAAVRAS